MPVKYAPALFLEVLAFWFVLMWLLLGRLVLLIGRLLVLMMAVGALGTLDEHPYVWAASFSGAGLLAWMLLRRWRGFSGFALQRVRFPAMLARRHRSATDVAILFESRLGLPVDAGVEGHSLVLGADDDPGPVGVVLGDREAERGNERMFLCRSSRVRPG